jgi:DNA polymerase-1
LGEFHPVQTSLLPELTSDRTGGTNPGSSPQVIKAFAKRGMSLKATDQRSLIKLVDTHPAIAPLLEWRQVAKVLDVVNTLPGYLHSTTQRLHPSFFQLGARSGRFSCRNPALQTIPRHPLVRQCFTAAPGNVLVKADYSQIELRIIARITRDPLLVKAYQTGQDVHALTASLLMEKTLDSVTKEERTIAKSINFGLVYGMSAVRLQLETQLKYGIVLSHAQALEFHRRFFELFQGVAKWHTHIKRSLYRNQHRQAKTLLGRVRTWKETPGFNEFINFPVQGTSADITKRALVALVPMLGDTVRLVLIVHDEIVLEVPQAEAGAIARELQACMVETATPILNPIPVCVDVQIAQSWGG